MSGPKIIDIAATREQQRLRIAVICSRMDALSDRAEFLKRSNEIRQAAKNPTLTVFALIDLAKVAEHQLEFVRSETNRLRREEIETLSARRSADQALTAMIRDLRSRCEDAALLKQLDAAGSAPDAGEKLRLYEDVRNQMTQVTPAGVDEAEIRAWIAQVGSEIQRVVAPEAVRWRQELQRIHAELHLLKADGMVAELEAFAGKVEAEKDDSRRRLMLDGLRLEVADHLRGLREREQRATRAAEWKNALYSFPFVDRTEWESRFARVGEMTSEEFQAFGEEVDKALDAAIKIGAAQLAKQAVLDALLKLGYELRKGMETALIEEGKVILKKPGEETYGVEISAPNPDDPSRIKAQVVRTRGQQASTPDALQADKEREEAWCEDSKAMQETLAAQGIETEIKAARPAGQAAVPVVKTMPDRPIDEDIKRPLEMTEG